MNGTIVKYLRLYIDLTEKKKKEKKIKGKLFCKKLVTF